MRNRASASNRYGPGVLEPSPISAVCQAPTACRSWPCVAKQAPRYSGVPKKSDEARAATRSCEAAAALSPVA